MNCAEKVTTLAKEFAQDALFIGVGFGVLGFQRAQVRRRELTEAITGVVGASIGGLDDVVKAVEHVVVAAQRQLRHLTAARDAA